MVVRLSRSSRRRVFVWAVILLAVVLIYVRSGQRSPEYYSNRQSTAGWPFSGWLRGASKQEQSSGNHIKIAGFCLTSPKEKSIVFKSLKIDDVAIRTQDGGTRTCCDVSVTQVYCKNAMCFFTIFGKSVQYKTPWHLALYRAIREAYVMGTDYFFMCQNCTALPPNWTEQYVTILDRIKPANLGMGIQSSGNYVFFHRTHIEIFGYVFPWKLPYNQIFPYLYNVYPTQNRIWLDTTGNKIEPTSIKTAAHVQGIITEDRIVLSRYVTAKQIPKDLDKSERKVIATALYGDRGRYIEGAIRNAQLAPIVLPGWTLRYYVPHPKSTENIHLRPEVIKTLKRLGAEVKYVNDDVRAIVPPMMWRFLVVDDPDVDIFLIFDSDSRLGSRVSAGLADWLKTKSVVYCMRDHPWHAFSSISGGLWGARRKEFATIMTGDFVRKMIKYNASYQQDMKFLGQKVWPRVRDHVYCHDSVSCKTWPGAHPWPVPRIGLEHVGEIYNEFHIPFPSNRMKLFNTSQNFECEPEKRVYIQPE